MHPPTNAIPLTFPVHFAQWMVAQFLATEEEMTAAFGEPHFVDDGPDTPGILEDNWAWQFPDGQCIRLVLEVPYDYVIVFCDPPVAQRAIIELDLLNQPVPKPWFKVLDKPKLLKGSANDA